MSEGRYYWALGAMSGTSLDGVDAAMLLTNGSDIRQFGKTAYRAYSEDERRVIRAGFGKTEGEADQAAAEVVEIAHTELLAQFPDAELVGFHGQTLHHEPNAGVTVQTGDGRVLAEALEKPVVWDFRTADVHLGGQGAPLAPFYHHALAKFIHATAPVVFLNIGGVANLTWVDPTITKPETANACVAFDTGPGNALIDDLCMARLGKPMDHDGQLTRTGHVDADILEKLLKGQKYLAKLPPKSLDRNDFSDWFVAVNALSDADAVATLAAAGAGAIARGLEHCPRPPDRILVSGGGRLNAGLMQMIEAVVPCPVEPVEAYALNGDMLEAQAFAFLAVRVKLGLPTSSPSTTGIATPVGGGQLSMPGRLSRTSKSP